MYAILVGDVLVRVAHGNAKPHSFSNEIDEGPLLQALEKAWPSLPSHRRIWQSESCNISNKTIRQIKDGNVNALVQLIAEKGICYNAKKGIDILHLCALGGFPKALDYLLSCNVRAHMPRMHDYSFGELAAVGGQVNILPFVIGKGKTANLREIREVAMKFHQDEFMFATLDMEKRFRKEREQDISKLASVLKLGFMRAAMNNMKATIVTSHDNSESLCNTAFPSLQLICASVVASETIRKAHSYAPLLLALPTVVLEMVFEMVARDSRYGYRTLLEIRERFPHLGNSISTTVWVEAVRETESRTRNFYWHTSIGDHYYPQPLIDIFNELQNAYIQGPDDYEMTTTKFLEKERRAGTPCISTYEQFLQQIEQITSGFLEGLNFSNIVVCGGCVATALLPPPSEEEKRKEREEEESGKPKPSLTEVAPIDIYLYGLDEKGYKEKIREVAAHIDAFARIVAPESTVQVVKGKLTLAFCIGYPFRNVRIMLGKFRNIWDILVFNDVDSCALAYDGTKLWGSMRACLAWSKRWNITDAKLYKIRGFPSYEHRLVQCANHGFTILDPLYHRLYVPNATEPEQLRGDEHYGFSPQGAQLIACIQREERVANQLAKVASRLLTPFGPGVGLNDISEYTMKRGLGLSAYKQFISTIEYVNYKVTHGVTSAEWYNFKPKSD